MTLYEYKLLKDHDQYQELWQSGEHISERDEDEYRYVLYQMFSFYVELKYDKVENEIVAKKVFSTTTQLEPYLNKINIPNM